MLTKRSSISFHLRGFVIVLLLFGVTKVSSWVPTNFRPPAFPTASPLTVLHFAAAPEDDNDFDNQQQQQQQQDQQQELHPNHANDWKRRELLERATGLAAGWGLLQGWRMPQGPSTRSVWAMEPSMGSTRESPIVVIGAGGKVGRLCTQLLALQGRYCRAVTRSGGSTPVLEDADFANYVTYTPADVRFLDQIQAALEGASGVIFAASASGKNRGGDPASVDYLGVVNTAKACLANNVPKLALISAGSVTRPESTGYRALNFLVKYVYGENLLGYKLAGEEAVRQLSTLGRLAYTIIRPGGLSDKPAVGPSRLHISQGDVYSSEISRQDIAQLTVAALLAGKATDYTTFEANQVEGLTKVLPNLPNLPDELVHKGKAIYEDLLEDLFTDEELKRRFSNIVNDVKDIIKPIPRLV